ncbi:MAG: hypothetical protein IPI55_17170 [Flavobacteriales bacterium]|nr:hypothetical protein [Flavobacteriales bacterium]
MGYHSSNCDCLRQGVLATPFTSEIVDNPSPDVGYGPRAFVEPSGAEHYFHTGGGVLRHSHRGSAVAAWTNVDASSASVPVHTRFGAARLSDGRLWACVADGDPLNGMGLLLVRSANTGWASQDNSDVTVLAVGFNVPPPCSVVALPNGHAAVMYAINDTQVEARLTQDALPAPFTVDGAGDRGRNPAMVREANGTLHVASYDASATSLRYSRKVPGTLWTNEEVDNVASVGSHASIAVDANGTVHVAYYDASANALRYTSGTSGAWAPPVVVDNLNNAGLYTSIMLDNAGAPAIAYVATGEARLARLSGTTWTRETVATGVTAYLSAARDGLGRFHLGWQAGTVLTYTRGVPGTWEVRAPQTRCPVANTCAWCWTRKTTRTSSITRPHQMTCAMRSPPRKVMLAALPRRLPPPPA